MQSDPPSASRLRLGWASVLVPSFTASYLLLGALSIVYLPARVAELDPGQHVLSLAVVSTSGTLAVIVSQPIVGWLSDRTRSRWGPRAPWIAAGALATVVLTPVLGLPCSVLGLAIGWALVEGAVNLVRGPAAVLLVDRIAIERRGRIAAAIFVAFVVGSALGSALIGPALLDGTIPLGILGATVLLGILPLIAAERNAERNAEHAAGRSVGYEPLVPAEAGHEAAGTPVARSELVRVFLSRALMMLAYSMVMGYLLFAIRDQLGFSDTDAARWAGLLIAIALGASLPMAVLSGLVIDRIGRHGAVAAIALVAMACAVLSVALAPGIPTMVTMMIVVGAAYGVHGPVERVIVSRIPRDAARTAGRDLGVLQIATGAAQLIAPLTAAVLIGVGGYAAMYLVGAVALGASAVLLWSVRSLRRPIRQKAVLAA